MIRRAGIVAVAGTLGGGLLYYQRRKQNSSISADEYLAAQSQQISSLLDSYSRSPATMNKEEIRLFRYSSCPFCGKVSTFLDVHGIPYSTIEVEPMFKSQIKSHGYFKVPQLQIGGEKGPILVESGQIVDYMSKVVDVPSLSPETQEWREWAQGKLVRYIVLNANSSLREAFRGFDYIDRFEEIPTSNKWFLKFVGGPVMYLVARFSTRSRLERIDPSFQKDGPYDEMLKNQVNDWIQRGVGGGPFQGGEKPSLADSDVYGIIQALEGHPLYYDILEKTKAGPWIKEMEEFIASKK